MARNTTLDGDRAGEDAFSLKQPKAAEKMPSLYFKNHWSCERRLAPFWAERPFSYVIFQLEKWVENNFFNFTVYESKIGQNDFSFRIDFVLI